MTNLTRREMLAALSSIPAASLLGTGCSSAPDAARDDSVPLNEERHRVTIIGSGFGGGVSALRLAQAGIPSVVLERGKRWVTGPDADCFPSIATGFDKRSLWYEATNVLNLQASVAELPNLLGLGQLEDLEPYAGVVEPVAGAHMTVLCPAGLGGGSLVYQGMTLQPTEALFNRVLPTELDYQKMDEVYYPKVAQMLKIATGPDELIASPNYRAPRYFKECAEAAGYDVEKIPMPIDWSFALRELAGEMRPSYTNGDCAFGVNNGGKHSVDVTYIAQAEATGLVDVRTLHNVTHVARNASGEWEVHVNVTDEAGTLLEQKVIISKALIMAAGSVNSTKLLLRAQAQGTIPNLPSALGTGWGSNADRIVAWTSNLVEGFGQGQGGPVIYGSKDWADPDLANTVIQASIPPLGLDLRTTMMVGFGISDARGTWTYDALTDGITLDWQREADALIHQKILERMGNIAQAGLPSTLLDTNAVVPSTWHPLGGACMETTCDLDGRVHDNPGLYVLDGALIPGSTAACNPSMTIAAVAERAIDNIIQNDVGVLI